MKRFAKEYQHQKVVVATMVSSKKNGDKEPDSKKRILD